MRRSISVLVPIFVTTVLTVVVSAVASAAVLCDMHVKYPGRRANPLVPAGHYRIAGQLSTHGIMAPEFQRQIVQHHRTKWISWGSAEGGDKIQVDLNGRNRRGNSYSLRLLFKRGQNGSCYLDGSLQGWS